MDRIFRTGSLSLPLLVFLLTFLNTSLQAQVCGCPSITNTTVTTGNCLLVNSGECQICPNSQVQFSINIADQLVPGTVISWYYDTDPDFDPHAGEGILEAQHTIPLISCSSPLVKINEFQPFPEQGDNDFGNPTTGEWVELIGPPGAYLGCYVLSDGDWSITIPPGTYMPSDGFFVIGYDEYGPVDLDVDTCNCFVESFPNETLTLHNTGEWLVLWNGFSFVDAVRYGNPSLANSPPFGNLVTLGAIPTSGMPPCNATIPISFPVFTNFNTLPAKGYTYEREPDFNGNWSLEECGSRGYCNKDQPVNLPLQWTYNVPASQCNQTLYFKAIVSNYPGFCPAIPGGISAGTFALSVHCPQTTISDLLCPGDSVIVNNKVYNLSNPSGVEIMPAYTGCDSTITVNLNYHPNVVADLGMDTVICEGDSALLTVNLSGDGPYQFVINTNGSPGPLLNSPLTAYSFWVKPASTTTYSMSILVDDNGCEGTLLGGATVEVNKPQATYSLDATSLCPGDTAHLDFQITGYAPWSLNYLANGQLQMGTVPANGSLALTPLDTTQYVIQNATDAYGCVVSLNGTTQNLNVTAPPVLAEFDITCLPGDTLYEITLELEGGIPGTYTLSGNSGTWNGGIWTSDPVKSLIPYAIYFDDAGPCPADTLTGVRNCDCATSPGKILSDTLHLCPGEFTSLSFAEQPITEPGDTLLYFLHTNPLDPQGSALATSGTPAFSWQNGWPLEQVLYLTVGISDKSPTGLDLSDPCLDYATPIPVYFHSFPTASFLLPAEICGEKCASVNLTSTGNAPVVLTYSWGTPGNLDTLTTSSVNGNHPITLCGDLNPGVLNFQLIGVSDKYCSTILNSSGIVQHPLPPVIDYSPVICPEDSVFILGAWYHSAFLSDTFTLPSSDPLGCDSLIQIAVSLRQPADRLIQQTLCSGSTIMVGDSIFNESHPAGQVSLPGASQYGCDSLVTVDLTFTDFTEFDLNSTICTADTVWVNGQAYTFSNPVGTETIIGGSYLGCDSVVQIALNFFPDQSLILSGSAIYCPGDQATLTINGTMSIYDLLITGTNGQQVPVTGWSPGTPIMFIPSSTGTYTITQASSTANLCPVNLAGNAQIDVEELTVDLAISSDYNGAAISCAGANDGQLTANVSSNDPPFQYAWNIAGTGPIQSNLGPGMYAVTVSSNTGCTNTATLVLAEPNPVVASLLVTDTPCGLSTVDLFQLSGGTPPWQWTIDGLSWAPINGPTQALPIPSAGFFLFSLEDANGCSVDSTIQIQQGTGGVSVQAFPDTLIGPGQPVQIDLFIQGNAVSYSWSPSFALSCTNCPEPIAKPTLTTTYTVTVVDDQGCEDIAMVTIDVLGEDLMLYIPTAFSPNLDGINDLFIPEGNAQDILIEELAVYDRWGGELWRGSAFSPGESGKGWDGNSRGKILDPGVYIYTLRIQHLPTKTVRTYQGEVLLMR